MPATMNRLQASFAAIARESPAREVLRAGPSAPWIRAGALLARSRALAEALRREKLRRGEIVMIAAGNRPLFLTATLAAWSCGAVILPVEASLPETEIDRLQSTFKPALAVRHRRGGAEVRRVAPPASSARLAGAAMIRLTSGTSGSARGAILPAGALAADGRAIARKMGISPGDVNIGVIPLSHSYGFDNLVVPLLLQATPLVLLKAPLPGLVFKALRSRRRLVLPLVPYLVDLLSRHGEPPPRRSGLRLCISAGAALSGAAAARFRERFGVPVRTFYGASEAGGIAFDDSPAADSPEGCVGTPLPGVRVSIERSRVAGLAPGEGRIVVAGAAVGRGYHPRPSPDFRGGRFRTMDLGYLDGNGRLVLTGRVTGMVNVSGRKVNPAEVERALLAIDGVEDAVVIGIKDTLRGERIEAWVVNRTKSEPGALRAALSSSLPAHKVPKRIHLVAEIPRTPRGKLDRVRLLQA